MTEITLSVLAMLLFGFGAAAQAQDLPPHQSLETRHICASQAIYRTPAGVRSQMLAAGEPVALRDVTFDPDGAVWFVLDYATGKGLERDLGYLPIAQVRHFCGVNPSGRITGP